MDGKKRNVFLKQFVSLKDALVFRLSNDVLQTVYRATQEELIQDVRRKTIRYWGQQGKYQTTTV